MIILNTKRLVLRPQVQSDARALHAILGDPEAMRFWHRPAVARLDVVEGMVREQNAAAPRCRYWTVWLAGDAIGGCDISLIDEKAGRAETGFLFRRDCWGHGYAGEAMGALTTHAFASRARKGLGLRLLVARTQMDNAPARRVLERLGFALEELVRGYEAVPGARMDCAVYALRRASSAQKGA